MYAWMGGQRRQTVVNRNSGNGRQRAFFQRQRDQQRTARVRRSGGTGQAGPSGNADVGALDEFVSERERNRRKGRKRRKRKREPEIPTENGMIGDLVKFGMKDIMEFDKATANLVAQEKKHRKKSKKHRSNPKVGTPRESNNRTFAIDGESNHMEVYENDVETSPPPNHSTLFGISPADNRNPDEREGRRDRKRRCSRDRTRNEQELEIPPSGRHTAHVSQRADGGCAFLTSQNLSHRTANVSQRAGEEEFASPRKLSRRTANVSERAVKERFPSRDEGRHRTANVSERKVKEEFASRKMHLHRTENVSEHFREEDLASSPKESRCRTSNASERVDAIEEFAESSRRNPHTGNAIERPETRLDGAPIESPWRNFRAANAIERPETRLDDAPEPRRRRRHRSGHRRDPRIYSPHDPVSDPKCSPDSDVGVAEVAKIRRPSSVRRKTKTPVVWPNKDTSGKGRMLFAEFNPAVIARELRMFKPDRSTGVFQYPPSVFKKNRLVCSPKRLSPKKSSPRKKSPRNHNVVVKVEKATGNPFSPTHKSTAVSVIGNNTDNVDCAPAIEPLTKELTIISIKPSSPGVSAK